MKLLQNTAGNFLNMSSDEARILGEKLIAAANAPSLAPRQRGQGFVQTIVLQEDRTAKERHRPVLDTIFIGIDANWIDVHPDLLPELEPREDWIMHIDRSQVNVSRKGHA